MLKKNTGKKVEGKRRSKKREEGYLREIVRDEPIKEEPKERERGSLVERTSNHLVSSVSPTTNALISGELMFMSPYT